MSVIWAADGSAKARAPRSGSVAERSRRGWAEMRPAGRKCAPRRVFRPLPLPRVCMYIYVHPQRIGPVSSENRKPITVRLDPKTLDQLQKRAAAEDRTMTAIIERALRLYFQKGRSERLRRSRRKSG